MQWCVLVLWGYTCEVVCACVGSGFVYLIQHRIKHRHQSTYPIEPITQTDVLTHYHYPPPTNPASPLFNQQSTRQGERVLGGWARGDGGVLQRVRRRERADGAPAEGRRESPARVQQGKDLHLQTQVCLCVATTVVRLGHMVAVVWHMVVVVDDWWRLTKFEYVPPNTKPTQKRTQTTIHPKPKTQPNEKRFFSFRTPYEHCCAVTLVMGTASIEALQLHCHAPDGEFMRDSPLLGVPFSPDAKRVRLGFDPLSSRADSANGSSSGLKATDMLVGFCGRHKGNQDNPRLTALGLLMREVTSNRTVLSCSWTPKDVKGTVSAC